MNRRFIRHGRQELELRVSDRRGAGAGRPLALNDGKGQIELTPDDLRWLCAVAPRAIDAARRAGRC